jgi:5-methylcytosine-specific restriction endonuclease McrA
MPEKSVILGYREADNQTYKKKPIPKKLRLKVLERDSHSCQSCGAVNDLTIDHIVPEKVGGKATLNNLQVLCRVCNSRKGARI